MSLGDEHLPEEEAVKGTETGGAATSEEADGAAADAGKNGNGIKGVDGADAGAARTAAPWPRRRAISSRWPASATSTCSRSSAPRPTSKITASASPASRGAVGARGGGPGGQAAARARHAGPGGGPLQRGARATEDGKALRASRAMLMDILTKEGLERVDQRRRPFRPLGARRRGARPRATRASGDDGRRGAAVRLPLEGAGAAPGHGPRAGVS